MGENRVKISNNNGSIKLRFTYAGKRRTVSPGLRYTELNLTKAVGIASQIELDILSGHFDSTMDKYKISSSLSKIVHLKQVSVKTIWEEYKKHKRSSAQETTFKSYYRCVDIAISKSSHSKLYLSKAKELNEFFKTIYADETRKRILKNLSAACNYHEELNEGAGNPYLKLYKQIKTAKSQRSCKSFSKLERDSIIGAFEENKFQSLASRNPISYYANFVKFLFFTGCRPEEAVALTWKDVTHSNGKAIVIRAAYRLGITKDTKTHEVRIVPINERLRGVLLGQSETVDDEMNKLVFPSRRGGYINLGNFTKRIWSPLVHKLVEVEEVSEYLPTYHTRHTFITLCLEAGITPPTIAAWVGNSPEVIMRNYASVNKEVSIPEI